MRTIVLENKSVDSLRFALILCNKKSTSRMHIPIRDSLIKRVNLTDDILRESLNLFLNNYDFKKRDKSVI